MAIALKFCVSKTADCKGFLITDVTKLYSTSNLGGWGAPNPLLNTALTATFTIELRASDGTWSTSTLSPVSAFSTFPSSSSGTYTLTAQAAGYGTGATFQDGIYRITYTVTGTSGGAYTATTTMYYVHTCGIDCCYQQAALDACTINTCCDGTNKDLANIAYYKRLLSAASCSGDLSLIQTYLDILTATCASCSGCATGCSTC